MLLREEGVHLGFLKVGILVHLGFHKVGILVHQGFMRWVSCDDT